VPGVPEGIVRGEDGVARCQWGASEAIYRRYHDREWGRPLKDDRLLFEKICLEGFQSGLSWLTILRKRENFRRAFHDFEIDLVAHFKADRIEALMEDAGIVRNRAKILATINNARRCLDVKKEKGSLAAYAWSFEPRLRGPSLAVSPEAIAMSKELKARGWAFVGPTTIHSFMQAVGMINDHIAGCQAREEVDRLRAKFVRPG
jgi:DNA-3-methyladenine glycosylase I